MIPRVTHTRLPEGRRETKVRANVHVRAQKRQENEERGTKCTGTPDEAHLIIKTWAT